MVALDKEQVKEENDDKGSEKAIEKKKAQELITEDASRSKPKKSNPGLDNKVAENKQKLKKHNRLLCKSFSYGYDNVWGAIALPTLILGMMLLFGVIGQGGIGISEIITELWAMNIRVILFVLWIMIQTLIPIVGAMLAILMRISAMICFALRWYEFCLLMKKTSLVLSRISWRIFLIGAVLTISALINIGVASSD